MEVKKQIGILQSLGYVKKTIARELGLSKNTVKSYLDVPEDKDGDSSNESRKEDRYCFFPYCRQTIVEHPYGTLKRQWGFSYILTKKGIGRASSDVGFMFIAYNLRRIVNILTIDRLKEYLMILVSMFLDLFGINFRQFNEKISLNLDYMKNP